MKRSFVLVLVLMTTSVLQVAEAQVQGSGGRVEIVLPADWGERDLEGKWVAYHRAISARQDEPTRQGWALALGEAKEFELLECIAVHEGWRFAGPELMRHDAPQMVRCAVWNLDAFDSHVRDAARKALIGNGPRVLGWFEAFPAAAVGSALELQQQLLDRGVRSERVATDLPPLDAMQTIVPWLDAPAELPAFGDRKAGEKRVRYEHQVVRALAAVLINGDRDGRIVTKVNRLTGHRNEAVQRAAFDTLAKLPAGMVPFAAMRDIVIDGQAAAKRRRSAVVVLSFSNHPEAMDLLVQLALDPLHPAHEVAVGRLAERGDPVAVEPLRQAQVATAEHERVIDQIVMAVERRHAQGQLMQPNELLRVMLRVAWLRVQKRDDADTIAKATAEMLRTGAPSGLPPALEQLLARPPQPSPFAADIAGRVERELRAYVRELLGK